jgi:putative restriction endonuclease|tara:strand:- start:194 stop:1075 length:882 start_codon:yes stop_codon:yes gene_type:complete
MPRPIIFGEIENFIEGCLFGNRKEMMPSSFHRNHGQGIDGNGNEGASAIVLSGGYEDDDDDGECIIYTGAGGRDKNGTQIEDQRWETLGNAGLLKSMDLGLPIRVIRGAQHTSKFSPDKGYRYGGLYRVESAWNQVGQSGFKMCRFRLLYAGDNYDTLETQDSVLKPNTAPPGRKEGTVLRIIRDTKISQDIKKLYSYACQVCGIIIKTKSGFYAEGAHIKPLGRPHNGYDSPDNMLCLCPNHHVMFDKGSFSIDDDFSLIGGASDLPDVININPEHEVDISNLKYHRDSHGY